MCDRVEEVECNRGGLAVVDVPDEDGAAAVAAVPQLERVSRGRGRCAA